MKKWVCKASYAPVSLLVLVASAGVASAVPPFSAASLRGNWALQLKPAKSFAAIAPGDPGGVGSAPRQDILRSGIIHWDSATAVTGHMIATTDDSNGSTVVIDYQFDGTYTVNTDGTGTLSIAPSVIDDTSCTPAQPPGDCATFEGPETYSISITRNRGMSFVQTDNAGGGAKIFLEGVGQQQSRSATPPTFSNRSLRSSMSFQMVPATSFSVNPPQICPLADPGNVAGAVRQDILRVGQMSFSGVGAVGGHTLATTDDNAGNTVVIDFTWAGVYSVNTDGTGTMSIVPGVIQDSQCTPAQAPGVCATLEGPETYAIAIAPKRGRVYFTQTDNAGGGAKIFMVGEANYQ